MGNYIVMKKDYSSTLSNSKGPMVFQNKKDAQKNCQ